MFPDTDFYQILSRQISILKLKGGEDHEIIRPKLVRDKLGISPQQYVTFKSLTGDTADNIDGIRGVGKVTARKIVRKEIDFDLTPNQELLDLNEKLIRLSCDKTAGWELKDFVYQSDVQALSNKDIFEQCGF